MTVTFVILAALLPALASVLEGEGVVSRMNQTAGGLTNADVTWEGSYIGLTPTVTDDAASRVRALGERAIPELIAALSDEHRFAAAHVMLTRLSGVEYQGFPAWNGLKVDIDAEGRVRIDPSQRAELSRRWMLWYAGAPRAKVLPG